MLKIGKILPPNALLGLSRGIFKVARQFSTTNNLIDAQLLVFPEYKEAIQHELDGKFAKAIPAFERIFDSLHSAVGIDSPLTTSLLYRMSNLHRHLGQFNKSLQLLQTHVPKIQNNLDEKVKLQQLQSAIHLLAAQPDKAMLVAEAAVKICEEQSNHHNNPMSRLLSSAYGQLGICHLFNHDLHEAETFLQMSCRWAESPTEHIVAAVNNGSLLWYRLANSGDDKPFNYWKIQEEKIQSKIPFLSTKENDAKGEVESLRKIQKDSAIYKDHVVHTLNGWLEAMEEAQKGQLTTGVTGCGPMNMTGLQSNDVTMIANTPDQPQQSKENISSNTNNPSALEDKLKADVKFAIAYSHLLYQISDLYELLGRYSESSDYLSSAMKAINQHSTTSSNTTSPVLGKILRQIAYYHMCNTQAVTAEGLYRAALEKFASPFPAHDIRYHFDVAVTKGYYGQLLKKWDKREALGEKYIEEYQQFLHKHYPYTNSEGKAYVPLTSMIQFPIDYL